MNQQRRGTFKAIAAATLLAFACDGTLSRLEGLLLVTMGAAFTLAVIRAARRESLKVKLEFAREFGPQAPEDVFHEGYLFLLLFLWVSKGIYPFGGVRGRAPN